MDPSDARGQEYKLRYRTDTTDMDNECLEMLYSYKQVSPLQTIPPLLSFPNPPEPPQHYFQILEMGALMIGTFISETFIVKSWPYESAHG